MKRLPVLLLTFASLHASSWGDATTFKLARELLSENDYTLAAVEFRRFAMESGDASAQSSAYLYAGYSYLQARNQTSAGEMLDRAENADETSSHSAELALLNGENAKLAKDSDAALYYYDALAYDSDDAAFQTFASRRSATIHLEQGDLTAARQSLGKSPMDETRSLQALDAYGNGKDKSPAIGGWLGMIPGAGYWYSGEIANGFRSLILNSIFIYGMADSADNDNWGAFTVITFFELTWYSGSIYGGVDAAQRYNRDRLNTAVNAIESDMSYRPDPEAVVPAFKLKILF